MNPLLDKTDEAAPAGRVLRHLRDLIAMLGDDPDRPGLQETPERWLKAWRHWCSGYDQRPEDVVKLFEDGAQNYDELVFQGSIPFYSVCEHHLAPFWGVAHIGYIPQDRIVGLSKMPRLVEVFARRLQVQERLTQQIAQAMWYHLQPRAVGIVLRCRHTCIESRGVEKIGTETCTSALLGLFKRDTAARAEFLSFVRGADDKTSI